MAKLKVMNSHYIKIMDKHMLFLNHQISKLCSVSLTTGCKPANAAPTAKPQNPASVMGVSMTLLGPNRSSRPFVTLYLNGGKELGSF